jgi:hypothetical protein
VNNSSNEMKTTYPHIFLFYSLLPPISHIISALFTVSTVLVSFLHYFFLLHHTPCVDVSLLSLTHTPPPTFPNTRNPTLRIHYHSRLLPSPCPQSSNIPCYLLFPQCVQSMPLIVVTFVAIFMPSATRYAVESGPLRHGQSQSLKCM